MQSLLKNEWFYIGLAMINILCAIIFMIAEENAYFGFCIFMAFYNVAMSIWCVKKKW